MKKMTATVAAITLAAALAGCQSGTSPSGNQITDNQQAAQDTQFAYVQPLPFFPFSQIRQDLIEIEAINALGIASTTFDFVPGISHPVLECPSIGVPIPGTDQLSNPVVAQWSANGTNGNAGVAVGQQEPDGVFTGTTTATGGLCVNGAGGQYLNYDEAYDISVTAPAYWDAAKGVIHIDGTPVMPVCRVVILNAAEHKAEEVCTKPKN